jgi:hypothetical protein
VGSNPIVSTTALRSLLGLDEPGGELWGWRGITMPEPVVTVVKRPELVWTAAAPRPVVVGSEDRTLFGFEHPDGGARVAELVRCVGVRFGFPNDEAQHGHPLWGAGLTFSALHEVRGSPWLDELRRIEAAHPSAPVDPFPRGRHFVMTFHDSTLEAIADDVRVVGRYPGVGAAVRAMAAAVAGVADR